MRPWLFDMLSNSPELRTLLNITFPELAVRIIPRESQTTLTNIPRPFIVYGLGQTTNEGLGETNEHEARRQFFQLWVHDEGGDYGLIDEILEILKDTFQGQSAPAFNVSHVLWLENSQEFSNETYNTLFRYSRFQAIISKGVLIS